MFSVSLPTTDATDARAALEAALAHVAEDSFFACTEPAPADWRESAAHFEWLETRVAFQGAAEGMLACRLPLALAADLASAFLGVAADELENDAVLDMAGELANMICGCWLTRAFPAELFDLGRPDVGNGGVGPGSDWLIALVNGVPFGMRVSTGD
jgi:CheY-specific phosphatase CheX